MHRWACASVFNHAADSRKLKCCRYKMGGFVTNVCQVVHRPSLHRNSNPICFSHFLSRWLVLQWPHSLRALNTIPSKFMAEHLFERFDSLGVLSSFKKMLCECRRIRNRYCGEALPGKPSAFVELASPRSAQRSGTQRVLARRQVERNRGGRGYSVRPSLAFLPPQKYMLLI